jgi:UDP-glucose:(heptosyl)LPS alpha-1,3-glucosyltransferase
MYIADLSRRLAADGHDVHLYACQWQESALPASIRYHRLPKPRGPRFLRPWQFGAACRRALQDARHLVSIGFNKTWGQDILYPQGGLHAASADHNLLKYDQPWERKLVRLVKCLDPAHRSFMRLEQRQYLGSQRPLIVVNSHMVQRHFQQYYDIDTADVRVIWSAIDPNRFQEHNRPRRRVEWRQRWGIEPEEIVGLFVAMNYRLKGLGPLLRAVAMLQTDHPFRLLVVGDPNTRFYEREARRLGIVGKVCFAGYHADTSNCYFASDFLVHPTFYDPCSLVVLEALACGLPVITSRYNGASELLHPPREGYVVVDPHDAQHLAWCMAQLLDPFHRLACALAARRTALQWTFEHHYRQLLQVFHDAGARKRAA